MQVRAYVVTCLFVFFFSFVHPGLFLAPPAPISMLLFPAAGWVCTRRLNPRQAADRNGIVRQADGHTHTLPDKSTVDYNFKVTKEDGTEIPKVTPPLLSPALRFARSEPRQWQTCTLRLVIYVFSFCIVRFLRPLHPLEWAPPLLFRRISNPFKKNICAF